METIYKLAIVLAFCVIGRAKTTNSNGNQVFQQAMKTDGKVNAIMSVNGYIDKLYGSFQEEYAYYNINDFLKFTAIAEKSLEKFARSLDIQHKFRDELEDFIKKIGDTKWEKALALTLLQSSIDETHRIFAARDCSEVSERQTGERYIHPANIKPFKVICNMDVDGGNWTVIQQRQDGSVNFNRTWQEYKDGFGDLGGEFWIGNDKIHAITTNGRYRLRFDIEDWAGSRAYAVYDEFKVGNEATKYKLTFGSYRGTAGNAFRGHNNKVFSTIDQDNDGFSSVHCSTLYGGGGGWWFYNCGDCKLNGIYGKDVGNEGVVWTGADNNKRNMKFTRMMIRKM